MTKRPFISKGIDELEQLFKSSGTDFLLFAKARLKNQGLPDMLTMVIIHEFDQARC